jgi:hypothetical protein
MDEVDGIDDLEDRAHFKRTFDTLKLICNKIAFSPQEDHSKELNSVLESLNSQWVQALHHYVLFPLEVRLLTREDKK